MIGCDGGELPWSVADIAVIVYSAPVMSPEIKQLPVTLRLVGAAKQVKV
jgi:hypothetical protein